MQKKININVIIECKSYTQILIHRILSLEFMFFILLIIIISFISRFLSFSDKSNSNIIKKLFSINLQMIVPIHA